MPVQEILANVYYWVVKQKYSNTNNLDAMTYLDIKLYLDCVINIEYWVLLCTIECGCTRSVYLFNNIYVCLINLIFQICIDTILTVFQIQEK